MKKITIIIVAVLGTMNCFSQASANWQWEKKGSAPSISNLDIGYSISSDQNGFVYIAGTFNSTTITFGSTTLTNTGGSSNRDIFIVKYDSLGNVMWAKKAGGSGDDEVSSIYADKNGFVYITGDFAGTGISFGGINLTGYTSSQNYYVAKYNKNGNAVWANTALAYDYTDVMGVTADTIGNVFVTGLYKGSIMNFICDTLYNSHQPPYLSGPPTSDIFIVKYNSAGTAIWAKTAGIIGNDYGVAVVTDNIGNAYITGEAGYGTHFGSLSSSGCCTFTVKYSGNGNAVWVMWGVGGSEPKSIALDGNNNVFITGSFSGSKLQFSSGTTLNNSAFISGSTNMFIAKYDSSGTFQWANGTNAIDFEYGNSVAIDANGNAFVTGTFVTSPTNIGAGISLTSLGGQDAFVIKYNSLGTAIWAKDFGGISDDESNGISIDASGKKYVTGTFYSNAIYFGSDSLTSSIATGTSNVFTAKLFECISSSSTITQTACNDFTFHGHLYNASGVYNQIITNQMGCDSTVTINLTIDSLNTSVTQNAAVLTANASSASYQWLNCSLGNVPIIGAISQTYTATTNGNYAVAVTQNGCTDTSTCYTVTGLGISENITDDMITIAPNPFTAQTTITFSSEQKHTILSVMDVLGNVILQTTINGKQFVLDMNGVTKGVYFVRTETDSSANSPTNIVSRKILINQ